MFCKFEDNESFEEFYDLTEDPYQLDNLAPLLGEELEEQRLIMAQLAKCAGQNCQQYNFNKNLLSLKHSKFVWRNELNCFYFERRSQGACHVWIWANKNREIYILSRPAFYKYLSINVWHVNQGQFSEQGIEFLVQVDWKLNKMKYLSI